MNSLTIPSKSHRRRKIHYVDEALQKYLLIGLVVLEAGLAGGLAWMMSWRLNRIIELNLYRVHLADSGPMLGQLMHEAIILLGMFFVANLLALLVVEIIWRRHVHSILRVLGLSMEKTNQLDFTADPEIGSRHQVLNLAESQRDKDRIRLSEIREQLSRLDSGLPAANDARGVQDLLQALDALLPQPAAAPSHLA
jgi:hypothetical protein